MGKFVSFPDIGQFRNIVNGIVSHIRFAGVDAEGNKIYDSTKELPWITFHGTIKLHGTNSAIGLKNDEYWVQSRSNCITPLGDNAGCAAHWYGEDKKSAIIEIVNRLREQYDISPDLSIILFGEWVGPKIQKNVAISNIPTKCMFLFGIRVVSTERDEYGNYVFDKWLPINDIRNHEVGLYNIEDYKTWDLVVDMNHPEVALPLIEELVDAVEKECPVSKAAFGVSGIGEGIVWTTFWNNSRLVFKTKGKLHSVTKHKDNKVTSVDVEKVNSVNEFISYAVTESRLEQGIERVFTMTNTIPEVHKTGDFLKWLVSDIAKEEIDTLSRNGLSVKDVNSAISKTGKEWFFKYLDKLAMGKI